MTYLDVLVAGLLFTCTGCLLYAIPHFTTPVYDPVGSSEEEQLVCSNRTEDICSEVRRNLPILLAFIDVLCILSDFGVSYCQSDADASSSLQLYMWVFILARVCLACGSSPMYQLGVTFMDDSLTKGKFSLYSCE